MSDNNIAELQEMSLGDLMNKNAKEARAKNKINFDLEINKAFNWLISEIEKLSHKGITSLTLETQYIPAGKYIRLSSLSFSDIFLFNRDLPDFNFTYLCSTFNITETLCKKLLNCGFKGTVSFSSYFSIFVKWN